MTGRFAWYWEPTHGGNKAAAALQWIELPGMAALADGGLFPTIAGGESILIGRANGELFACRNVCPCCGDDLETGSLHAGVLRCLQGHAFEVPPVWNPPFDRRSEALEFFPLLTDGSCVHVAVPAPAQVAE